MNDLLELCDRMFANRNSKKITIIASEEEIRYIVNNRNWTCIEFGNRNYSTSNAIGWVCSDIILVHDGNLKDTVRPYILSR